MQQIIQQEVTYNLKSIIGKGRKADLEGLIAWDNHKSTSLSENIKLLLENYKQEVKCVWVLPVTMERIKNIRGAGIVSIGVTHHFTTDDKSKQKSKVYNNTRSIILTTIKQVNQL